MIVPFSISLHQKKITSASMYARNEGVLVALLMLLFGGCVVSEVANLSASLSTEDFFKASHQMDAKQENRCHFPSELLNNGIILFPDELCRTFYILRCYCLTTDGYTSTSLSSTPVIGKCLYACFSIEPPLEYNFINLSSESDICSNVNRKGVLCGQCREGYGVPAYSFTLKCVTCGHESLWTNISRYILMAYGPLTVFLAVIVVFTVSVNSAPLRGYILVCQLMTSNIFMYSVELNREINSVNHPPRYVFIFASVYEVWNLDFFRFIYKPFCLHLNLTTLQVMSLDYIIAAYPLVLIFVMYVMVELYSSNFRPMVLLGRLLHHCCVRFRNHLNIRTSLIDAFGTFFSLSFVKFLSTSLNLLISTPVWANKNNTYSWHVYFDGSMQSLRGSHIPFAVGAITVTVLCNILPLVLMLLYSFPRGQIVLRIIPGSVQRAMYPFVDNILACYKDGTNGTRNCRYFALIYYFALIGSLISSLTGRNAVVLGWNAYVCILAGMLVAVIQPYKSNVYNRVDTVLILSVGLWFAGAMSYVISSSEAPFEIEKSLALFLAPLFVPQLYITGYIIFKIGTKVWAFYTSQNQFITGETCERSLLFTFPQINTT